MHARACPQPLSLQPGTISLPANPWCLSTPASPHPRRARTRLSGALLRVSGAARAPTPPPRECAAGSRGSGSGMGRRRVGTHVRAPQLSNDQVTLAPGREQGAAPATRTTDGDGRTHRHHEHVPCLPGARAALCHKQGACTCTGRVDFSTRGRRARMPSTPARQRAAHACARVFLPRLPTHHGQTCGCACTRRTARRPRAQRRRRATCAVADVLLPVDVRV
jgi:hypothetical protein